MSTNPLKTQPDERLRFLVETVLAESALLQSTDDRLFAQPMTAQRAEALKSDPDLAERVDAFVARFAPKGWGWWPLARRGSKHGSCATS